MANITINEISQNYTYNIGRSSYATVAFPITACWGPGLQDVTGKGIIDPEELETIPWTRFPANQAGLESFVSTYRGPASQYILRQDYSYQMAMTLLNAGYDILITRVATGNYANGKFSFGKLLSEPNYSVVSGDADSHYTITAIDIPEDKVLKPSASWENSTLTLTNYGSNPYVDAWDAKWVDGNIVENTDESTRKTPLSETQVFQIESQYAYDSSVDFTTIEFGAKYLGTFGNSLRIQLRKLDRYYNNATFPYWNLIVYVQSAEGVRTAVENINFVFNVENSTDTILHIDEIASNYITIKSTNIDSDDVDLFSFGISELKQSYDEDNFPASGIAGLTYDEFSQLTYLSTAQITELTFVNGEDLPYFEEGSTTADYLQSALEIAKDRYSLAQYQQVYVNDAQTNLNSYEYISKLSELLQEPTNVAKTKAIAINYREWMFTAGYNVLDCLTDKLAYNPNRIIFPGWDDQDFDYLSGQHTMDTDIRHLSPLHIKLMDIAFASRCATAYIDIPRSIKKSAIYNEVNTDELRGYAQSLSRYQSKMYTSFNSIYSTHSALFAPWGKYAYVGSGKQAIASPSFLALMIDRAMIKNQTSQYEWQLPTNRKHNLKIGKMDYTISKKYLDIWQTLEGVGINCITQIPDLGLSIWGNSTLYEVPPATYQALANLSTRKLVNAVEDLAYRCGIAITFQYNNEQAYNAFYAGMTPLLDTMRNVGAIEDYYLRMSEDVNGLDQVNANSVIGKIYLVIDGVINDINIDLIALPPQTDLDQFRV